MSTIIPIPTSRRFIDLTGAKFGRLVVVGYLGRRHHSSVWYCDCECGASVEAAATALKSGETKSCGCYRQGRMATLTLKHGGRARDKSLAPEWKSWEQMRVRCTDSSKASWKWYGGKGVTVHPDWLGDFGAFLRDVGPRPSNRHTIDRIDSAGNYEPGNVRWATWTEQARNRSSNRIVEYDGKSMPMVVAAELAGIPYKTVKGRLAHGWSMEAALTKPVNKRKVDAARANPRKAKRSAA